MCCRAAEDTSIRGIGEKAQSAHIRGVKDPAKFLGRSPDTATSEDLRNYQLQMKENDVSASTFNSRIVALRFFFGVTCGKEGMKRYMQFQRKPARQPVVLSVEEVSDLLTAAPGPGLKFRAALGISYGAGLRAAEVCNLRLVDIDSAPPLSGHCYAMPCRAMGWATIDRHENFVEMPLIGWPRPPPGTLLYLHQQCRFLGRPFAQLASSANLPNTLNLQ